MVVVLGRKVWCQRRTQYPVAKRLSSHPQALPTVHTHAPIPVDRHALDDEAPGGGGGLAREAGGTEAAVHQGALHPARVVVDRPHFGSPARGDPGLVHALHPDEGGIHLQEGQGGWAVHLQHRAENLSRQQAPGRRNKARGDAGRRLHRAYCMVLRHCRPRDRCPWDMWKSVTDHFALPCQLKG